MTNRSSLALIAAVAAAGIASPAFAQTASVPEVMAAYPFGALTPPWYGPNDARGSVSTAPVAQIQPKQGPLYNYVAGPSTGGTTLFRIGDDGGIAGQR